MNLRPNHGGNFRCDGRVRYRLPDPRRRQGNPTLSTAQQAAAAALALACPPNAPPTSAVAAVADLIETSGRRRRPSRCGARGSAFREESDMPMPPPENPAWGFVQWSLTGLATLLASGGAFLWRLMQRLERLESAQARQRIDIDASRSASEAALFRLGERLTQMHDDYFRLRETIGALPTRSELRDIGDHLAERLASLADRLDRAIDH